MSTVVQVVVVVKMMMIMIKVFGCSIEESGFVRACCLYYRISSAGLLSKTPLGRTASLLLYRFLRERNGGIGSCILTFDPRVLFISVLIRSKNAHFGSYHPPVTRLRSLGFLFVVGLS